MQHLYPSADTLVVIKTNVIVVGRRRGWREMYVCRKGEGRCATTTTENVGDWAVGADSTQQERWRFTDTGLEIDVELGTAISYAEAEMIIHAIHRKLLKTTPELQKYYDTFQSSRISIIRTIDPIAREFQVYIDNGNGGYTLSVRLNGNEVELFNLAFSVA